MYLFALSRLLRAFFMEKECFWMARELPKVYEPQQVENRIYSMWEDGGYFRPCEKENAKPFTIVFCLPLLETVRPLAN